MQLQGKRSRSCQMLRPMELSGAVMEFRACPARSGTTRAVMGCDDVEDRQERSAE